MGGFSVGISEETIVTNPNLGAITYRIEFIGAGYVEFAVAPGAQFKVLSHGTGINMNIQDYQPAGLRIVSDDETETGRG